VGIETAADVKDRYYRFLNFFHEGRPHPGKRTLDNTGIVNRANLVHKQIGIVLQFLCGRHAYAQRNRILDEMSGKLT
jgi:hypothetical protein